MGRINGLFQRTTLVLALLGGLFLSGVSAGQHSALAAGTGPCDIYASGGTPCVAAHTTTRALFGAYSGRLYQVRRASAGARTNVGTLRAAGFPTPATPTPFSPRPPPPPTTISPHTSNATTPPP